MISVRITNYAKVSPLSSLTI